VWSKPATSGGVRWRLARRHAGEGGGYCDAVLFARPARRATTTRARGAELAAAFAPSKERHPHHRASRLAAARFGHARRSSGCKPAGTVRCLSGGVACAGHVIAAEPALLAYLQALAANSFPVRLIPLGKRRPARARRAGAGRGGERLRALAAKLDDIGSALRADLASARHEPVHAAVQS
jgi:urease accessory protein UreF